jgi:hypothetical protein
MTYHKIHHPHGASNDAIANPVDPYACTTSYTNFYICWWMSIIKSTKSQTKFSTSTLE